MDETFFKRMLHPYFQEEQTMPNELEPIVDQWYLHRDKGEMFRVVAIDEPSGTVEIQGFGGDVEEVEAEAWRDLDIELAEPPEDWSGPFDDLEAEDRGESESEARRQDWRLSAEAPLAGQEP